MSSNPENNPPQITNQPEQSDKVKTPQETPKFDPEKFKSADNCNHCKNCKCPCHHWLEMREKMKGEHRGMRGEHRGMFRGRGMFGGRGMGHFGHFPMFPPWMMHRGGFGRGHHPPPPNFEGEERGRGRGRHHHHPFHFWGPPPRPRNHSNDHYENQYDYGYGNYDYDMYDEGYEDQKPKNDKNDKKEQNKK